MNILGLDYGHKRIGLAYAETELGVAVPIAAAVESDFESRMAHIANEIKMRVIHRLVVGYPYNMDGSASQKMKEVDAFVEDLKKRFGLPVDLYDERLSSFQAESDYELVNGRPKSLAARKKHRRSGDIDSRAIALVLAEYLTEKNAEI